MVHVDFIDELGLVNLLDDVCNSCLVVPRIGPSLLLGDVSKELGFGIPLRALALGLEVHIVHYDTGQDLVR